MRIFNFLCHKNRCYRSGEHYRSTEQKHSFYPDFDKGYYGYKNYTIGISRFKVIPVIFPRKNLKMEKLMGMLSYPLPIFNRSNPEKEKKFYNKGIVKSLKAKLENWKKYKPIRGMIEDIFKLVKDAFSLKSLHRYTERSVKKIVCLHVFLVGVMVLTQRRIYRGWLSGSWWWGLKTIFAFCAFHFFSSHSFSSNPRVCDSIHNISNKVRYQYAYRYNQKTAMQQRIIPCEHGIVYQRAHPTP